MIKSTKTQSYGGLSMVPSKSTTNKRTFKHFTEYDRGIIYVMHKHGKSLQAIADEIGCHKSTISRELKRGSVKQMKTETVLIMKSISLMLDKEFMKRTGKIVVLS